MAAPRVWIAEPHEAETVAALLVEFRDWYGRDWPSANDFLLGAPHDDAAPGGVCQLRYRFSVWTAADDCWLEDVWVRPGARRQGLGRALVEAACARAAARGCRRIELDVHETNGPALALYESLGFATGKLPGGRDLFMARRLP